MLQKKLERMVKKYYLGFVILLKKYFTVFGLSTG